MKPENFTPATQKQIDALAQEMIELVQGITIQNENAYCRVWWSAASWEDRPEWMMTRKSKLSNLPAVDIKLNHAEMNQRTRNKCKKQLDRFYVTIKLWQTRINKALTKFRKLAKHVGWNQDDFFREFLLQSCVQSEMATFMRTVVMKKPWIRPQKATG